MWPILPPLMTICARWMTLLPPELPQMGTQAGPPSQAETVAMVEEIKELIRAALEVGVPTYNNGDHAGCARVYCLAAQSILDPKAKLSSVLLLEGLGPSKIIDLRSSSRRWWRRQWRRQVGGLRRAKAAAAT